MSKMSLTWLLLFVLIDLSSGGLIDWFKKGKALISSKKNTKQDKMFLVEDVTLYPGTNQEYREYHRSNWKNYYDCLNALNASINLDKTLSPEARMVFEGNSIRLECKICLSPNELSNIDSVVWYVRVIHEPNMSFVDVTEHVVINPEDKSLHMYNVQTDQTGQYACRLGNTLAPAYYLTVANDSEPIIGVKPITATKAKHAAEDVRIDELDLNLTTTWGKWSACNKCGKVGKKVRTGICTIIGGTKSEMQNDVLTMEAIKIIKYFGDTGVPCRSHITPQLLLKHDLIATRSSEIMTAFCYEKCPGVKVFEVRDEFGNLIESANNSAGIYSMMQGLPDVDPSVDRTTIYGELDRPILLSCPGNLNSDTPVLWQIGTQNIIPNLLAVESQGRIYVTNKDAIRINKLEQQDAGIYSCWQRNQLAGTIRLEVIKRIRITFNHHVMLLGIFCTLGTFQFLLVKAYMNRKLIHEK